MSEIVHVRYVLNGTTQNDYLAAAQVMESQMLIQSPVGGCVAVIRMFDGWDADGPALTAQYSQAGRILRRPDPRPPAEIAASFREGAFRAESFERIEPDDVVMMSDPFDPDLGDSSSSSRHWVADSQNCRPRDLDLRSVREA